MQTSSAAQPHCCPCAALCAASPGGAASLPHQTTVPDVRPLWRKEWTACLLGPDPAMDGGFYSRIKAGGHTVPPQPVYTAPQRGSGHFARGSGYGPWGLCGGLSQRYPRRCPAFAGSRRGYQVIFSPYPNIWSPDRSIKRTLSVSCLSVSS